MKVTSFRSDKGFTLVELIMVIVIIGILSAVAVPKFVDLTGQANKSKCAAFRGALNSALAMEYGRIVTNDPSQGGWLALATSVPTAAMMASGVLPECPMGGAYTYSNGITSCDYNSGGISHANE